MPTFCEACEESNAVPSDASRRFWWLALCLIVVVCGFLAGLRTVTDFDLGWQMATGRWIVAHHQIPSTEVFSYTASGQPWIYPVGSALLFYASYSLGGWPLLSWLGALVCAATVALLLRRGNLFAAALAVVVIPRIALHTTPRADMFTPLLFAAFLSILWEQRETGHAKLWLLPVLAAVWVNLHLGFISGLALLATYVAVEILDMIWPELRSAALHRLRFFLPWFAATVAATVVNPWGMEIYKAILRQNAAMAEHSQSIIEWASAQVSWPLLRDGIFLRNTGSVFYSMLLLAGMAVL
ncbi:MAG TPA: hypothetical protein VJQ82_22435, partial [Terriglobales bacterium]|nr:hypothetical protein [Terriglobales bacterium]